MAPLLLHDRHMWCSRSNMSKGEHCSQSQFWGFYLMYLEPFLSFIMIPHLSKLIKVFKFYKNFEKGLIIENSYCFLYYFLSVFIHILENHSLKAPLSMCCITYTPRKSNVQKFILFCLLICSFIVEIVSYYPSYVVHKMLKFTSSNNWNRRSCSCLP